MSFATTSPLSAHAARVYRHSLFRYLVIGSIAFVIDLGLLIVGKHVFGLPVLVAATISYWASIIFNFIVNRLWSFDAGGSNLQRHMTLYAVLLVFNYGVSLLFIVGLGHFGISYVIAKTIAVLCSTLWNYVLYKYLVFKP